MNNIDYAALIDEAMQYVVKKALQKAINNQLPGNHHFFISFLTHAYGVVLSEKLKARYPKEMTIVLQHQFENLVITDRNFSVQLSFDNTPEKITIPWDALTAFADPSVKFGLQFNHLNLSENSIYYDENDNDENDEELDIHINEAKDINISEKYNNTDNVIPLDKFRKK